MSFQLSASQLTVGNNTAPTANTANGFYRRSNYNSAWQSASIVLISSASLPSATCYYLFNGTGATCPAQSWTAVPCALSPRAGTSDTLVTLSTSSTSGISAGTNTEDICTYFEVVFRVDSTVTYYSRTSMSVKVIDVLPEITSLTTVGSATLTSNPGTSLKFRVFGIDLPAASRFSASTATLRLNMSAITGISPVPNCGNALFSPSAATDVSGGGLELTYTLPSFKSGCKIELWSIVAPTYGVVTVAGTSKSVVYLYSTTQSITAATTAYQTTTSRSISISGSNMALTSSYTTFALTVSGGSCGGSPACSSLTGSASSATCVSNLNVVTGDAAGGCVISGTISVFANTKFNISFTTRQIATAVRGAIVCLPAFFGSTHSLVL